MYAVSHELGSGKASVAVPFLPPPGRLAITHEMAVSADVSLSAEGASIKATPQSPSSPSMQRSSPRSGAGCSSLLGVSVSDVMMDLAAEPEFALGTLAASQWLLKKSAYAPEPPPSVSAKGTRAIEAWAAGYDSALRSKV
jgi:hypothetical protein